MKFKLIQVPKEGNLPWEYEFEMGSAEMAISYGYKIISYDPAVRLGCTSLQVWRIDEQNQQLIADFVYQRLNPKIINTLDLKVTTDTGPLGGQGTPNT